jgi:hypothetical protein
MTQQQTGGLDPSQISVDNQGRIVIDNPILAEAIRKQLSSGERAAAQLARRPLEGTNLSSCGNNC